jgi:hypothetical protein
MLPIWGFPHKQESTMKSLWIVIVLQQSLICGTPLYVGDGVWAHSSEESCLDEARTIQDHMEKTGHPVDVKCERVTLEDGALP